MQEIATSAGKTDSEAVIVFMQLLVRVEMQKRTIDTRTKSEQKGHRQKIAEFFNDQKCRPFDGNDDWLAMILRETSVRLIGNKADAKAIESARGIKFGDLHPYEKTAFKIVLGVKRARLSSNKQAEFEFRRRPPALRIADDIRRNWLLRFRKLPERRGERLTGKDVVIAAIPLLDELAGAPIRGGDPQTRDPNAMEPPALAVLYALAREWGARIEPREISAHISRMRTDQNLTT